MKGRVKIRHYHEQYVELGDLLVTVVSGRSWRFEIRRFVGADRNRGPWSVTIKMGADRTDWFKQPSSERVMPAMEFVRTVASAIRAQRFAGLL